MPPDGYPLPSPRPALAGAAILVALYALQPARAAPGNADALRVQRAEIIDAKGFDKPMVAATVMVPAGWKHGGEVQWNIGRRCGKPYGLRLQAGAPDGSEAIELALPEAWGATNYGAPLGDCPQAGLRNAREYLTSWIGRHRKDARLVEYKPRPDKSQVLAQNQWAGGSLRSWVDSGQALITYRQGGREMHELLVANVVFSQSRLAGAGGQALESLQGQALGVLGWRRASGPVPQRHFDLMWATLKAAPEWQARINAAEQQMAAENAATQAQISRMQAESSRETLAHIKRRGEIRNEAMQETARMRNETWRSGQATQDRMHKDTVRTIREVQGYRDPRGVVVELPQHYDHAWQLRDGSYVLTDDPSFDPGRDLGMAGEKLQRTRE
ncbi:MAG: hypothetical protein J0H00_19875 [Burkholderiales bacterium]|nr:hypothetical protein [Burkholderiales bacterium]